MKYRKNDLKDQYIKRNEKFLSSTVDAHEARIKN